MKQKVGAATDALRLETKQMEYGLAYAVTANTTIGVNYTKAENNGTAHADVSSSRCPIITNVTMELVASKKIISCERPASKLMILDRYPATIPKQIRTSILATPARRERQPDLPKCMTPMINTGVARMHCNQGLWRGECGKNMATSIGSVSTAAMAAFTYSSTL
jgi:hypothetical protein